jgi:hypothetical protein
MKHNLPGTEIKDNDLGRELAGLHEELAGLNERRVDLYKRSLEADEADKATADMVANAMLSGPLATENQIKYPLQVNDVAWADDNPPVLDLQAPHAWVKVQPYGEAVAYLGVHCGDVAGAVSARFAPGDILRLEHAMHVPVIFVPYLGRFLTAFQAQMLPIEGLDDLDAFTPEQGHADPWFVHAHAELSASAVAGLEAEGPGDGATTN